MRMILIKCRVLYSKIQVFLNRTDCWHFLNTVFFSDYIEPVQLKPPVFSSDSSSYTFKKHMNTSFALLCQAQSWPVGVFKWVTKHYTCLKLGNPILFRSGYRFFNLMIKNCDLNFEFKFLSNSSYRIGCTSF